MGSFFTNVHVRSRNLEAVLAALRADASQRGQEEVREEAGVDRAVVVFPPLDGWITIYDQATESQDTEMLDALAKVATKATGTLGFSALVHDSDVLELRLYRAGTAVDRLSTDPDYFERKPSKKKADALAGDPSEWAELADETKLAKVFGADDLFAESTLTKVADLVGLDTSRTHSGYRYFDADALTAPEDTITLRFRSRVRPSWEQHTDGPPGLEEQTPPSDRPLRLAVPDELRVSLTARSIGRASNGLEVRTWGSALESGAVVIDRFEVVVGNPLKNRAFVTLEAESTTSVDGATIRYAKSADVALPAGSATAPAFQRGMDISSFMDAIQSSNVHVNVVGRCIAPGGGEIGIALLPLANPEEHAATVAKVEVSAPITRPLRFDERLASMPGGSAHVLAPLVGDRWHIALLVSDRSRAELTDLARAMIEDARFVVGSGKVHTTIFRASPGAKPGSGNGKTTTMLTGKRFESFLESMRTEQLVSLVVTDEGAVDYEAAGRDGGHGRFGLSLGTGVSPHFEEDRVPSLMAWLDPRHAGAAAVVDRWAARFDAEMESGHGIQATVTRGSWQPQGDHTAYETATGIAHGIATLREWATRWLRVPGNDRTWLSAQLLTHLKDRGALDAVADVAPLGDALRITLRDRARFAELERALGDLLPTGNESHAVSRAFFARHATRT